MPLTDISNPLHALGIPSTTEYGTRPNSTWSHSKYYFRHQTSGIRAAIKLAREDGIPLNEGLARKLEARGRPAKGLDDFLLELTDKEPQNARRSIPQCSPRPRYT